MGKKKPVRIKHIPLRTCVGCRSVTSKRNLIRLVKTDNTIIIDPSGKKPGRGVYLHADRDCWKKGLRGPIEKGLKIELTQNDRQLIANYMETLPENATQTGEILDR